MSVAPVNRERVRIDGGVIVAFQDGGHRNLRDGVVVVEGNEIVHVGKTFDGPADRRHRRPQRDRHARPDQHPHPPGRVAARQVVHRGLGRRQFYYSGLFEMLPARSAGIDDEARRACVDYSMAELLRTGTTTVMEIGGHGDYTAQAAEKVGLRAYIANGYRSGRWYTRDGKTRRLRLGRGSRQAGLQQARSSSSSEIDGTANGRIKGFLSPAQVDTCTEELLRMSREASDSMRVPLALHTSQSVNEFQEMVRRNGMTPVEWLQRDRLPLRVEHPRPRHHHRRRIWAQYTGDDLAILADAGIERRPLRLGLRPARHRDGVVRRLPEAPAST